MKSCILLRPSFIQQIIELAFTPTFGEQWVQLHTEKWVQRVHAANSEALPRQTENTQK